MGKRDAIPFINSAQGIIAIIDSSRDCIKTLDLDGNLLSMNKGGQILLEIEDIQPYLHQSWIDFWKDDDNKNARKAVMEAKKGRTGYFEGYCPTTKGTPKWWEIIISPIVDDSGKIFQLLSVSRDITKGARIAAGTCCIKRTHEGNELPVRIFPTC